MNKKPLYFILVTSLALSAGVSQKPVSAQESGIVPEVSSRVWQSDTAEFGSVCLNGKELMAFTSDVGDGVASEKADELAIKLSQLLNDKSFDPEALMPGKDGKLSVLKVSNEPPLTFEPSTGPMAQSPLQTSFNLANAIRTVYSAPTLPDCFLKLAEKIDSASTISGKSSSSSTKLSRIKSVAGKLAAVPRSFSGTASWYGPRFHGKRTSDGSRYDQEQMTAAHRTLPFGTKLLVMNRKTGQACVVKVNDRGPFVGNRVIDLSKGAARELKMLSSGVAMVDCLVLGNSGQIH